MFPWLSVAPWYEPRIVFFINCFVGTGVFSKRFCRKVPRPSMPRFDSSSSRGREVKRLSKVTVQPLDKLHFSIRPSTTSAP